MLARFCFITLCSTAAVGDHGGPAPAPALEPGLDVKVLPDTTSSVGLGSSATASTFSLNISEITETSREQLSEEL
jgi:hypothetical protein